MDLRIAITNKKVQEILGNVSKVDKRILVQEAILHFNDEILKGNTRSIVYDPHETDKKENIQQEKQPEITGEVENGDDMFNFTLDFNIDLGGETEDGHKDECQQ